jgi:hypothetical protein
VGVVLVPALVVAVIAARLLAGRPAAAVLLGLASGSLWGVFAVLTKAVVDQLGHGIVPLLAAPELYGWAAVAVLATALQQSAFRAGSMAASLPVVTISEPMVGSTLGVVLLGEQLRPGEGGWVVLGIAATAMVFATVALARSEAVAR